MSSIEEVFAPVDGSESSIRAARVAATLASSLAVPLTLGFVIPLTAESAMALSKLDRERIESLQRERAESVLVGVREQVAEAGVEAPATEVRLGDPAEEILRSLDARPGAMVVIGRRGLSTLQGLLIGSVSDKVVRHARNPVTIVN